MEAWEKVGFSVGTDSGHIGQPLLFLRNERSPVPPSPDMEPIPMTSLERPMTGEPSASWPPPLHPTQAAPPSQTFWQTWKKPIWILIGLLTALLVGIFGALAILVGVHLDADHKNLHGLVDLVVQQQRAPPVPPSPPQ